MSPAAAAAIARMLADLYMQVEALQAANAALQADNERLKTPPSR